MKQGIICIESDFLLTDKENRLNLNSEPLMQFLKEMHDVNTIYRRVATRNELQYYLKQLRKYSSYNIIMFSLHGDKGGICLEGEEYKITMPELLDMGGTIFRDKLVHFSSCQTLSADEDVIRDFKYESEAFIVSGYTKSVEDSLAAINDVAFFSEYLKYSTTQTIFKNYDLLYAGLRDKLGFIHY